MSVATPPRPETLAEATPVPAGSRWPSRLGTADRFALIGILLLLVGYPLVWILIRGLQGPDNTLAIAPFFETFTRPEVLDALVNSLSVNVSATLLAGAIGSLLAWALSRTDVPGRALLDKLVVVPFITMTLVGSFAWVVLAAPRTGLLNVTVFNHVGVTLNIYSKPGQIFVMTVFFMPFVYLFASRALRRVDPALEDAAVICGRPRFTGSLRIMLPLVAPAILAALILTFAMTMEEFGVFAILATPTGDYVLTTLIWRYMNSFPADYTSASALACLLLALTALTVLVQRRIMNSRRSFVVIGGREYRPGDIPLRGAAKVVLTVLCWGYVAVSVILPALGLLTVSMYSVYTATLTTTGLGLDNWRRLVRDGSVLEAARNSALLSLGGALVALALTTVAAYLIHRRSTRGKGLDSVPHHGSRRGARRRPRRRHFPGVHPPAAGAVRDDLDPLRRVRHPAPAVRNAGGRGESGAAARGPRAQRLNRRSGWNAGAADDRAATIGAGHGRRFHHHVHRDVPGVELVGAAVLQRQCREFRTDAGDVRAGQQRRARRVVAVAHCGDHCVPRGGPAPHARQPHPPRLMPSARKGLR